MTPIQEKYEELGGVNSFLGEGTTLELPCPDGLGLYRHYQGGSIYWHPDTGAFEVHGGIRTKWAKMGWELSSLGYPRSDEQTTGDGEGRYSRFQHGYIYWHADHGAFVIDGPMLKGWQQLGAESSFSGYPLSDVKRTPDGKGFFAFFEKGNLFWFPDVGITLSARQMPRTVEEANDDRGRRRRNLIVGWVLSFIKPWRGGNGKETPYHYTRLPEWSSRGNARTSLRRIAAVLYFLGRQSEFHQEIEAIPPLVRLEEDFLDGTGIETDDFLAALEEAIDIEYSDAYEAEHGIRPGRDHLSQLSRLQKFQTLVEHYLSKIGPQGEMSEIGTTSLDDLGDYDMVLMELAAFLYAFKDLKADYTYSGPVVNGSNDVALLTYQMIYSIVGQNDEAPFTFSFDEKRNSKKGLKRNTFDGWWQPETENHVITINTWNYLISNFIMWQGSLPFEDGNDDYNNYVRHMRALLKRKRIYTWLQDHYDEWQDFVLQVVGRVVHNGCFETNARPYEYLTLTGLLVLAAYAEKATPFVTVPEFDNDDFYNLSADALPNFAKDQERVAQGAKNAVYYLAVKFAFQSLEGKRSTPMRRNYKENRHSVGFYQSDQVPDILGILSGAYVFGDWTFIEDLDLTHKQKARLCKYYYKRPISDYGGCALWAGFTDFELPPAIHDFMLNKHWGYFARMQARFTAKHYELGGLGEDSFHAPRYFTNGHLDWKGKFKRAPELYFATDEVLLSAGGKFSPYYDTSDAVNIGIFIGAVAGSIIGAILGPLLGPIGAAIGIIVGTVAGAVAGGLVAKLVVKPLLEVYHFSSKPTMVISRGDIGGYEWWGKYESWPDAWWEQDLKDEQRQINVSALRKDVLLFLGDKEDDFAKSDNIWIYKNFAYGYEREEHDGREYREGWPQLYPEWWDKYLCTPTGSSHPTFKIGQATFKVFDFANKWHPLSGHYLIMAKMWKKGATWSKHRYFRRGMIEIVPWWRYSDGQQIIEAIKHQNKPEYFNNKSNDPYYYVTATTNERLELCSKVGHSDCKQAFRGIWRENPDGSGDIPVDIDEFLFDYSDTRSMQHVPLITVWGIGLALSRPEFAKTVTKYVESPQSGVIIIRNPFIERNDDPVKGRLLVINSSNYSNPKLLNRWPPG